jgi:hypothetical protein
MVCGQLVILSGEQEGAKANALISALARLRLNDLPTWPAPPRLRLVIRFQDFAGSMLKHPIPELSPERGF